jgi:drug/metabolite transporter (DMT)-like permease
MSRLTTSPELTTNRPSSATRSFRPWWRWMLTALAMPPAGYLGWLVAGHVDSASAAALAGVVTGALVGLGQWLLLRRRGVTLRWAAATAVALGIGLTVGAALVGYDTDRVSLAVMGAVSGLAVGIAQASALRAGRTSVVSWGGMTGVLWALGWIISSFVIDPAEQWPIFGISGALVVTLAQSPFIERVLPLQAKTQKVTA